MYARARESRCPRAPVVLILVFRHASVARLEYCCADRLVHALCITSIHPAHASLTPLLIAEAPHLRWLARTLALVRPLSERADLGTEELTFACYICPSLPCALQQYRRWG